MLYKIIGENIRAARKKARITQAKLAEFIDVSPSHYSGLECGKKKLSLAQIVMIGRYLHVPLSVLLSGVDDVEVKTESIRSELPLPVQEAVQEFCWRWTRIADGLICDQPSRGPAAFARMTSAFFSG